MNIENLKARLAEIEKLDDLEEQGYQSASIICEIVGCPVEVLLQSAEAKPMEGEANIVRDRGLRRWCREQLGIGQGSVEA